MTETKAVFNEVVLKEMMKQVIGLATSGNKAERTISNTVLDALKSGEKNRIALAMKYLATLYTDILKG